MWAHTVVRRSGHPLARSSPIAASLSSVDPQDLTRQFSSEGGNDNRGPRGGGGGGRGGGRGGRGGGGRGGWRNNNDGKNENNQEGGQRGRRPQKPNFSDQFLEPAARGELKNHRSGIPKMTGRKPKGHGVRGADPSLTEEEELELMEMEQEGAPVEFTNKKEPKKSGTIAKNSPLEELNEKDYSDVMAFIKNYQALITSADPEAYYWNEMEYDETGEEKKAQMLEKLTEEATRDADGNLVVEVDDETFAMFDGEEDVKEEQQSRPPRQQGRPSPADDPAFQFVMEMMGIKGDKPPSAGYDEVRPLELQGPDISDFVESMMRHPTKFGELRYEASNEESIREPIADSPKGRANPPKEFVEGHTRFIYVWGLAPLTVDGQPGDLENPVHCLEIQKRVGSSFDVPTEQVSVASLTSAFVGFTSQEDQRFAVAVGPMTKVIESPVTITKYEAPENFALAKDSPDALVLLQNLPSGLTPFLLAGSLFPAGTDVGEVYGNLSPGDVVMLSSNSAVLRMDSAEMADSAMNSSIVQERLVEVGQHRVRYSKARRELVFSGLHGGPDGQERLRKNGPRLVVDGDMPTKQFFLSHATSLYLRNLDPSVTKQQIAETFQPFCTVPRDVEASVEFVTCQEGLLTGRAFVGFDELGEAEAALQALAKGGKMYELGPHPVITKTVKEISKTRREQRSARNEDALLDSLHNWEQYVDPADLEELLDHGISKEALDEALRTIRYQNPTFASLDQAMRTETLNPEKDTGGMYQELVQSYIATLKECVSTPENPGPVYDSLFFPGEEVDTEIFDREPQRQEELRKRREVP